MGGEEGGGTQGATATLSYSDRGCDVHQAVCGIAFDNLWDFFFLKVIYLQTSNLKRRGKKVYIVPKKK